MSSEQGHFEYDLELERKQKEERRQREQTRRRSRRLKSSRTVDNNRIDPLSNSIQQRRVRHKPPIKDCYVVNNNCLNLKLFEDCRAILGRLQSNVNLSESEGINAPSSGSGGVNHSNLALETNPQSRLVDVFGHLQRNHAHIAQIASQFHPQISCDNMLEKLQHIEHYQPPHLTIQTVERLMSPSSSSFCPLQLLEVSLLCPLSKTKMKLPIRSKQCKHLGCCDAITFLSLVRGKPPSKWKCPICSMPMPYEDIKVDGFLSDIIKNAKDEALKIEFTSSTKWRVMDKIGDSLTSKTMNTLKTKEIIDLTHSPLPKSVGRDSEYQVIDLTNSP